MPRPDNKQACEFIRLKTTELAEYMETQGISKAVTGSVLLGIGAGWVAAERGNEVAFKGLDMARAALESAAAGKRN